MQSPHKRAFCGKCFMQKLGKLNKIIFQINKMCGEGLFKLASSIKKRIKERENKEKRNAKM